MSDTFGPVNFGNAKELVLPDEGNYELEITDYSVNQAKNPESRSKGFNVAIKFKLVDGEAFGVGDNFRIYHNVWYHYENPWTAKEFFEALTGEELVDDSLDITDPDNFVGMRIGAILKHDSYTPEGSTKTKMKMVVDSVYHLD